MYHSYQEHKGGEGIAELTKKTNRGEDCFGGRGFLGREEATVDPNRVRGGDLYYNDAGLSEF